MEPNHLEQVVSDDGKIIALRLNRPHALNALTAGLMRDLRERLEHIASSEARVVILSGNGRSFSAGVDLKAVSLPDYTPEVARAFAESARASVMLLESMPQVTIAKVHGHCFTGALELVLGCDFIIAADNAIFCDTHAKLGMQAGWGMSQRLVRRVGHQWARAISYTAQRLSAAEAEAIGLILKQVPHDQLDDEVLALTETILPNSRDSIAIYKELFQFAENHSLAEGIAEEAAMKRPLRDRSMGISAFVRPKEA
jgi:enoyl-CoA hydratase